MATRMNIDTRGFNQMILKLKKINKEALKPVVRAVTEDVLASAASKTKKAKAGAINESIKKNFRKPFEVPGVGLVGVTKDGKVWVNLFAWGSHKKWALLGEGGRLRNVPSEVRRTGNYRPGSIVNLGKKNISQINSMIKTAKAWKARETKYRKSLAGLGKASWYHIMKQLQFKIPSTAPGYATQMKIPIAAERALKSSQTMSGNDNFSITISNEVQSCLNPSAGGMSAFARAINGQVKNFEKRISIDAKKYAREFAEKHGFAVK